jgi:hypothetical protein
MSGLRTREPGVGSSEKAHPPSVERVRLHLCRAERELARELSYEQGSANRDLAIAKAN